MIDHHEPSTPPAMGPGHLGVPLAMAGGPVLDATLLLGIAEDAPIAIAVVQGSEHRFIYANALYRGLRGADTTSILGRTIDEVFPDVRNEGLALLTEVYATAQPVRRRGYRTSAFPARANSVWNLDLLPILASQNDVRGVVVMLHDVTDVAGPRRHGDEHARQAEEARHILDGLMQYIPEGIIIADAPDGAIRMISRYAAAVATRPAAELFGIRFADHIARWGVLRPDGTWPSVDDLPLTRAVRAGEVATDEEWLMQRPNGDRVPVMCNAGPIRGGDGRIVGGVLSWHDISALKREMDARRQVEESLLVALDAAEMATWDLDLVDGTCRRSARHDRIFGYRESLKEWGVSRFLSHVVDEDREVAAAQIEQAKAKGMLDLVCRIRRADTGEVRWVALKGRVRSDESDRPRRLAAIIQDVTATRNADAAARQAAEQAQRADRAVVEAIRAHFRTLTPRQRDVMALVAAGHPNKEIAYRLGISERTVEGHRARVMEKMQANNLADLVRIAGALGIGPCAPAPAPHS